MPKCSWKNRLLQLRVISVIFYVLCLIAIIQFFSSYGTYNYTHIPEEQIQNELYRETVTNLVKKSKVECKYDEILTSTKSINSWEIPMQYDDFSPNGIANGSYVPEHCNPAFSVAILVTYRNRQKQLDIFLPYMHNFLRKQNIHYKIFVIEQQDEGAWNKGALYNIGARHAISQHFPCLILHDVDLLPLDHSNLYACSRAPRHMSASVDKFRFVLPYPQLVGGVLALPADQFVAAGGLSTRFLGWGGEDDDFWRRLAAARLPLLRFPRAMSRYHMLRHRPEPPNGARRRLLAEPPAPAPADGYHSARYRSIVLSRHRLFERLAVTL